MHSAGITFKTQLLDSVSEHWNTDWKSPAHVRVLLRFISMAASDVEYRCFVGGLAWSTDDVSLERAFSAYGEIVDSKVQISSRSKIQPIAIINDRETGRSRGFGFVTFRDEQSMRDAIEGMNGQILDGRSITVNEAQNRRNGGGGGGFRSGGGGGYGGGGYGGGGRRDGGGYSRGGGGGGYGRERGYGDGGSRFSRGGDDGNWRN
ncbi:hypothetical protein MUK42_13175 [Musa troglodytarum]|uniref:RRM domain-containing protein n=1 Tax=Musa troglodytarum TaxID=320322 RepID=A0A9E7KHG8_9LILI|nr:hypothetical protein MUK42_13175 [Musa troglodytarum]URE16671.1 hypothetical protein MUK42_13175 [Musa troglodytarum]